jgi:hypothetical protein
MLNSESVRCTFRADSIPNEGGELNFTLRANSAANRWFLQIVVLLCLLPPAAIGQTTPIKPGSWSGILVSSACNADEAFAESPECNKNVPGAKLALYDDTNRVMYGLEPQSMVTQHLGDTVTATGTLDDDTIRLSSIDLMAIGLAVGQKAPSFSVHDQFGRVQTLESLKGTNGTVLLFFRSADW